MKMILKIVIGIGIIYAGRAISPTFFSGIVTGALVILLYNLIR